MNRAEGEPTHRSADSWEQGWGPWAHQRQEESFQLPGQSTTAPQAPESQHLGDPGLQDWAPGTALLTLILALSL